MELVFREIDANNYQEVYTFNLLHEYSWRDSSDEYIPDSEVERDRKSKGLAEKLTKGDQKYHCLAVFDGENMVAAHFLDRFVIDKKPACHVHGLWVHGNYRNKGIARELKKRGEAWARSMGCALMDSNVRVANQEMISLNKALGYEIARYNFRKNL